MRLLDIEHDSTLQYNADLLAATVSQSHGRLHGRDSSHDEVEPYATAVDPGSPTDVDTDDEFVTPRSQSPSPLCRSSNRRLKASPFVSLRPNDRKRPLDSSDDTGRSPKLTKTLKGTQPAGSLAAAPIPTPPIFKKPALHMARSFQAVSTSFSSVSTSFNTTAASSQETNATSANTSFASYDSGAEPDRQRLYKAEKEAFAAARQREDSRILSQELSRESSSTFGSVDEDELLEVIYQAEKEPDTAASSVRSATATSPETGVSSNSAVPEKLSLTASFPPIRSSFGYPTLEQSNVRQRSSSVGPLLGPQLRPQQPITPVDSPSKYPWYIRDIPESNLFVDNSQTNVFHLPYFLLFICCRLSINNNVAIELLLQQLGEDAVQANPRSFWNALGDQIQDGPTESTAVWSAARKSFEGYTFKGRVSFKGINRSSVFKLEPSPIEPERSCQLQRMFGSDRFLYLTFPSFSEDKPGRFDQDQMAQIEDKWKLWILEEHSFLGRTWRVFHIEPIKRRKSHRKDDSSDKRVVLFATSGLGITEPMSVGEMLNAFMPLDRNQEQNFCKAYARLDLGLSRTIPTLVFKPSQIRRIRDEVSDGSLEEDEFNDKTLNWSEKPGEPQVMNDGCARISVGAALKIWEAYRSATGSDEPFPSAFQGRIRGAKGMWMVSAEAHTRNEEHKDIWIEIADSQSKFEPALEDEDDNTYNSHRLTFNYVQHSFVNGSTDLHISFIPILVDRGVERHNIADFMEKHLDIERKQLLETLTEPVKLHNWVTKQGSAIPANGIIAREAALPKCIPEKVKYLLRAGFTPQDSPFLARGLMQLIRQRQSVMEQKLRAPLGSATFLLGLADPENVLRPGEVHINFSSPFVDEFNRQTYRHLDGLEVLIARQPACRQSDIQKVRVVAHPQLAHLRDVVVFATRGQYPLAGKLQGGDYDGDTFWICWESILVEPFKNAPAPMNPPDPAAYGIKKDHRRVNEVMDPDDPSSIDGFLREAFTFRLAPSLLGKATNFLEKVAYRENKIVSPSINALCDVHDLLVDAPKQAYRFTITDFNKLVKSLFPGRKPEVPKYKQAMEASTKSRGTGEIDKDAFKQPKREPENILDYLYFHIMCKHHEDTRQQLGAKLLKEQEDDPELRFPYEQLRANPSPALRTELQNLLAGFERIVQEWNRNLGDKSEIAKERYSKLLQSCYASFRALKPSPGSLSDPEIAPLVHQYFGPDHPAIWETIRASAFYVVYPKKLTLVWHMAGRELAKLKADGNSDTYNVVPAIFADLKAKPHKVPKPEDDDSDDEFESAPEKAIA
ncbi:RNA-directed RNA polymerase 2 [Plenodomus tracheiphilus IPT5]|uniref:RNA-dependent RNA polymerase n=1 Tax=Plenodomus tracheiphilus IPT5 TaxID=1408161 RepID=A0A6A7ARJ7_9PLEO|nr:RNA-directed RNA polymerase 2 [Plenodomus tracheiphilus IPT5]